MYTSAEGNTDLAPSKATAWVGWIFFAGIMMVVSGIFDTIWGIVGIARNEVFVGGPKGNVINLDYTAWGWIHVALGIVMVAAGLCLFTGSIWASVVAILLAALSSVGNLMVIGAYPVWSTIVITLDVLVIYAITVHGDELRNN
jgi:hypothetical protein